MKAPRAFGPDDLTDKMIARFWTKVDRGGPEDCWLWTGSCGNTGMPQFSWGRTLINPNRVALAIDGRRCPAGDRVLFCCGEARCMNWSHLTPASGDKAKTFARERRVSPHGMTMDKVRRMRSSGLTAAEAAEAFDLSYSQASDILGNRSWVDPDYQVDPLVPVMPQSKLTIEIVSAARVAHRSGTSISALAQEHGVSFSTMSEAVNGLTWKHVPAS